MEVCWIWSQQLLKDLIAPSTVLIPVAFVTTDVVTTDFADLAFTTAIFVLAVAITTDIAVASVDDFIAAFGGVGRDFLLLSDFSSRGFLLLLLLKHFCCQCFWQK